MVELDGREEVMQVQVEDNGLSYVFICVRQDALSRQEPVNGFRGPRVLLIERRCKCALDAPQVLLRGENAPRPPVPLRDLEARVASVFAVINDARETRVVRITEETGKVVKCGDGPELDGHRSAGKGSEGIIPTYRETRKLSTSNA